MVQVPMKGKELYQAMLQKGVIVRPLDPYQLSDYVRITVGTAQENDLCLKVLEQVLLKEKAE
jgi:histidinol-phosphate aminotransferase